MGIVWLRAVLALVGCAETPCEEGCGAEEVCWYGERDVCVPAPDGQRCPLGYVYRECGTSSCEGCRDCVAACLPEDER